VGGGRNDDDVSDLATTQDAPQCVSQQRLTAQRSERLGRSCAEPHTSASGDQDDGNIHGVTTSDVLPRFNVPQRSQRSGGENLVEDGLGLVLVGLLGERKLGDKDLTGLGEHALLAG